MAPVRRSSRRIRKELPEVSTQEMSKAQEDRGQQQLRVRKTRQGNKEVEESVKMKHEDSIVVINKPPKSRRIEHEGAEENQRPTRRKQKTSKVEVEVIRVDIEKDNKEPPKSPTLIRNIASPVSTRTDRQVLRDVPVDQQIQPPEPKGNIESERLKKQYALIKKTSSFSETFSGRLAWKKKHYDKPVTSTPVPNKTLRVGQERQGLEKDVKDCFGFNSDDEHPEDIMEYSTLISPIAKVKNGKLADAAVVPREREEQKKADGVAMREREELKKAEVNSRQREQKKPEVNSRQREQKKPEVILRQREQKKPEVILRNQEQKKPHEAISRRRDKAPTRDVPSEKHSRSQTESLTRPKQGKEPALEVRRSSRRDRPQLSNAATPKLAEAETLIIHQQTIDLTVTKVPPPPDKTPVYDLTASEDDDEKHKANFSQLLHKYNPEDSDDGDKELCFNPHLVKATYGNKNKFVKLPARPTTRGSSRKSIGHNSVSLKSKAITKKPKVTLPTKTKSKKKKNEDQIDQKTEKWLQEMSKEFEEIEKFPLLIEKSP